MECPADTQRDACRACHSYKLEPTSLTLPTPSQPTPSQPSPSQPFPSQHCKHSKAIHLAFDGCTTKRHGKVLVIRVTATVPKPQGQEEQHGQAAEQGGGQAQQEPGSGKEPMGQGQPGHEGQVEHAGQSCSTAAPRLTTIFTDVLGVIQLASGTAEAHVRVIMRLLGELGLAGMNIAGICADSASVNMGEFTGVIARISQLLREEGQVGVTRAQPCYSHGIHNTLLKGLVVLPGTRAAITDLSSLLAQHWVVLKLDRWGAKPETPCDTRWASYITAASSLLAIWRHAGDAVAEILECQQRRAPAWARELCKHLQDSDLLLKVTVVAVVGQTYLMPELLWASKDDGLHAFELYRHIQQVCKGLQQPWANNAQLLSQLHSKLQQLVPADQREHQKQQLATYLQQHCAAMEEYYTQHCKRQLGMPHLMAALGGSDPQSCKEVAAKVVQCAALRMDDGQSDPGVWDPHCTWQQFKQDIHAMAEGSPCSTGLRLHLEVYFLACPISNAPVESLLQLLKHGAGRFMELPALLEHMSLHTHRSTLNSVDVHDFTLQLPMLRTAVRLEEVAAASARAPARAARKATAAACCVGGVVVNVGDHASQQRVAAAAAAGCNRVVPAGVQPPQQQPPQQQGRSSWGTAPGGQMLAPPVESPQGPTASPDLRHMYQLALATIATQGQAAPAQGSELGAAAPAPGFTLRKRTTPAGLGLPKTAAKRKR
ncbi:hypothetical protein QJQ45_003551 [Haematococcus lacustris]|nr:hypothetical protein QJQ45_003551 [Haematococcus lacustris]